MSIEILQYKSKGHNDDEESYTAFTKEKKERQRQLCNQQNELLLNIVASHSCTLLAMISDKKAIFQDMLAKEPQ